MPARTLALHIPLAKALEVPRYFCLLRAWIGIPPVPPAVILIEGFYTAPAEVSIHKDEVRPVVVARVGRRPASRTAGRVGSRTVATGWQHRRVYRVAVIEQAVRVEKVGVAGSSFLQGRVPVPRLSPTAIICAGVSIMLSRTGTFQQFARERPGTGSYSHRWRCVRRAKIPLAQKPADTRKSPRCACR